MRGIDFSGIYMIFPEFPHEIKKIFKIKNIL